MARLVAHARAVVHRGEDVAARLRAVGENGERARARGALGHEIRLHEDLDGVVQLQHVAEKPARRARRLPGRQPVALGDAGALEDFAVHLEVALLVGELEEAALLQLVERRVGGRGRDVVGGRELGVIVVRELIDGALEITATDRLVRHRLGGNRRALREVALALACLQRDVAFPRQVRRILEAAEIVERDLHSGTYTTTHP